MTSPHRAIHPLLTLRGASRPALAGGVDLEAAGRQPVRRTPQIGALASLSGTPDDLAAQRWGIVRTDDDEGALLEARVKRLTEHRGAQQGATPMVYRVPPGLDADASDRFVRETYFSEKTRTADRPRYLLLLGDAHGVSWELQRALAVHGAYPGRLAFDDPADYDAYVDKVLSLESRAVESRTALYYVARGSSPSIVEGIEHLMLPSKRALAAEPLGDAVKVESIRLALTVPDAAGMEDEAREMLARAAARDGGLLVSMSHGLGLEKTATPEERRAKQGALVVHEERCLTGEDVAGQPFFRGGAWFFLACFSAGTPASSVYHAWLTDLASSRIACAGAEDVLGALPVPPVSFVAALPKAVLRSPDGPLAVFGHVDLAWTYGFAPASWEGRETVYAARHQRFGELFKALLARRRFGAALSELSLTAASVGESLVQLYSAERQSKDDSLSGPPPALVIERAYRWMEHNDLGGFVLLGDPAARLPPTHAEATKDQQQEWQKKGVVAATSAAPASGPTGELLRFEQDVIACLPPGSNVDDYAPSHGHEPAELQAMIDAYREAGRRALADHLAQTAAARRRE